MKNRTVIVLVIGLLLLLVVRAGYIRFNRANRERRNYPKNLGFHFSATVDSLQAFSRSNGLVYFLVTNGELALSTEDRINRKLKFNGSVRFILQIQKDKLAYHSRDLEKYQVGDNLAINSDVDKISVYRQGKPTAESAISLALSGRFF